MYSYQNVLFAIFHVITLALKQYQSQYYSLGYTPLSPPPAPTPAISDAIMLSNDVTPTYLSSVNS